MNKRESEIILIRQDFSDRLQSDEVIESCAVTAYLSGGQSGQCIDFDISSIEYVNIRLLTGRYERLARSYPAGGYRTAKLCLFPDEEEAAGFLSPESVDNSGYAISVRSPVVEVQAEGGNAGETYRIVFIATTSYGNQIIKDVSVDVIPD